MERSLVVVVVIALGALIAVAARAWPAADRASPMTPMTSKTSTSKAPPELGVVQWRRGYAAAVDEARQAHKPLLVLFDEVPGCSTVNAFGKDVLSDVVVADAFDEFFVSVFVSNNESGPDRAVLEHFGEPAWNNPVVRIFDVSSDAERELAPRHEGADRRVHVLARVLEAMRATHQTPPPWLQAAAVDHGVVDDTADELSFGMSCFWEGEVALGRLPGVRATTPGFVDGHEAVRVRVDPAERAAVERAAAAAGFTDVAGAFTAAPHDDKHQLSAALSRLPLGPLQRARLNSAVGRGEDPLPWLSPRQRALLR